MAQRRRRFVLESFPPRPLPRNRASTHGPLDSPRPFPWSPPAAQAEIEQFLLLACKGLVATFAFCAGALLATRRGHADSFGLLVAAGYGSWALVWRAIQAIG